MAIDLNGTTGITTTGLASNGIDDNATSTAMTLDTSGNVLVGRTSSSGTAEGIRLLNDGFGGFHRDNAEVIQVDRKTSNGTLISLRKDGSTVGSIGTASSYIYIANGDTGIAPVGGTDRLLPVNGSGAVRDAAIDMGYSSGRFRDLYLSGGVYLGGTGSANKLDDYEEGTWTPTLPSGGTVTSTAGSVYTKIGNVVYYQMIMQMSGIPSNSTSFYVGGLPFTPTTSGGRQLHGHSTITYINNVDGSTYGAGLNDTSSRVYWHSKANGNQLLNSNFTGVTQLILSGFYYTA